MKENEGLFCIDFQTYGEDLWGTWTNGDTFSAIDILAVPCGTAYQTKNGDADGTREDCVWDKS